ncbi:hypothetical protein AVEN_101100-1 [Araneus ventricosus]|uniref:Uncharacterized protein n=1 Tax=Araneus ventricosus TaxID=182803 RepID=A0A4Y2IZN9_ARAVE|nr:hypothetical protein AVEN_101100-1 [Araneus ventricosus]
MGMRTCRISKQSRFPMGYSKGDVALRVNSPMTDRTPVVEGGYLRRCCCRRRLVFIVNQGCSGDGTPLLSPPREINKKNCENILKNSMIFVTQIRAFRHYFSSVPTLLILRLHHYCLSGMSKTQGRGVCDISF